MCATRWRWRPAPSIADSPTNKSRPASTLSKASNAANFHAAFDAFESVEAGLDLFVGESAMLGAGRHRQRVAHIQFADHIEMKFETGNFKFGRGRPVTQIEGFDRVMLAQTKTFHRAMRNVEQWRQAGVVAVGQKLAIAGNKIDQAFERSLHRAEIFKYVRVVKFQIVDNDHFRHVVDKFTALVKKGGVVLIPLDDEPGAVGEARPFAEIKGNSTDQKTWVQSIVLKNPGKQRSRGCLAV